MLPMRCIRRDERINLAFDAISHAACSLRGGATIARPWSSPQALALHPVLSGSTARDSSRASAAYCFLNLRFAPFLGRDAGSIKATLAIKGTLAKISSRELCKGAKSRSAKVNNDLEDVRWAPIVM